VSEPQTSAKLWASKTARKVTIVLLTLQLVGCAVDMVEPQATLLSIFCMATFPENLVLEWAGFLVWIVLAFSWTVGAAAIKFSSLRPFYWVMLICIPIAFVAQDALLKAETFHCDAP